MIIFGENIVKGNIDLLLFEKRETTEATRRPRWSNYDFTSFLKDICDTVYTFHCAETSWGLSSFGYCWSSNYLPSIAPMNLKSFFNFLTSLNRIWDNLLSISIMFPTQVRADPWNFYSFSGLTWCQLTALERWAHNHWSRPSTAKKENVKKLITLSFFCYFIADIVQGLFAIHRIQNHEEICIFCMII